MSSYDILFAVMAGGLFGFAVFVFVTGLPFRRERHFTFRRVIAASRQSVWDTCSFNFKNSKNAALHGHIVSQELVERDPEIWESLVRSSRSTTGTTTSRAEIVRQRAPELLAFRNQWTGDTAYPLGPRHLETIELQEHPSGTLAILSFQGETATLYHYFNIAMNHWRHLRRLRRIAESGDVTAPKRRGFWLSLAFSVLAVGSFAIFWSWMTALIVSAVLLFHEFGHWLAMRMTGQPSPKMMLVPFFGGVAIPNQAHVSRFNESICFLMGPGLSVLLSFGFMIATLVLAPIDLSSGWPQIPQDVAVSLPARVAILMTLVSGGLNLLQLVPVLPLDGGQILRSCVQSFNVHWAKWTMIAITSCTMLVAFQLGYTVAAGLLSLGVVQAWFLVEEPSGPRPMGMLGVAAIVLGYCLASAVHFVALSIGVFYYPLVG